MKKRRLLSFLFIKDVKFWYFKYILGAIIFALIITGITIHFGFAHSTKLINALSKHAEQTNVALSLDTIVEILKSVQTNVMIAFIIEGIVLMLIGVIMSLYLVHRIMGPLNRLQREIQSMIEGKTPIHPVSVRKGDYTAPFVELINKLINTAIR
ncbi:MAG: hypothetical protein NZ928_01190 [Endomicrobia bacterium]|nr:hypothetical protein [Endomicrobiia bacterium]MCX7940663.1 hypothetical protein [Endomicrobiia bacterium]MDW8055351.1 hypothetical protein [Elusimicrobiota bacterium]